LGHFIICKKFKQSFTTELLRQSNFEVTSSYEVINEIGSTLIYSCIVWMT